MRKPSLGKSFAWKLKLSSIATSTHRLYQPEAQASRQSRDGLRRAAHGPRSRKGGGHHGVRLSSPTQNLPSWLRACNNNSQHIRPPSTSLFTPLNVLLLGVLAYTTYALLKPSRPATLPREEPAVVFKTFTPQTLLPFNGEDGAPVYLAVRGRVFDVTKGRNFYGPGGPYANFAGRDASRGLAKGSFDEDMLTKDLEGPLDTLSDLGPDELEALQGWEERFLDKYMVVGKLVAAGDLGKE